MVRISDKRIETVVGVSYFLIYQLGKAFFKWQHPILERSIKILKGVEVAINFLEGNITICV